MIPIDITKQIVPGTLEHTMHWLVDNKINIAEIENKYKNDDTGAPAHRLRRRRLCWERYTPFRAPPFYLFGFELDKILYL